MHKDLVNDNLKLIIESIKLIEQRFSQIKEADDFVRSAEGVMILDSICMRLQGIGELVKKIDKIDRKLLLGFQEIEWINIMRLRDIISHHYEQVDYEIIYDICQNQIPRLNLTVLQILKKR